MARFLVYLLAAVAVLVALPLAAVGAWIVYWKLVPAYSASTEIAELQTTLTLRFYYTTDEIKDNGRYLDIAAAGGVTRITLPGIDWAHYSRTCIYLRPEHRIGIVGPSGEYLLSPDAVKAGVAREPSDDWTYLGAFDFQAGLRDERRLRFIGAAEQAQCLARPS